MLPSTASAAAVVPGFGASFPAVAGRGSFPDVLSSPAGVLFPVGSPPGPSPGPAADRAADPAATAVAAADADAGDPRPSAALRVMETATVTLSSYRPGAMLTTAPVRARATACATVRQSPVPSAATVSTWRDTFLPPGPRCPWGVTGTRGMLGRVEPMCPSCLLAQVARPGELAGAHRAAG